MLTELIPECRSDMPETVREITEAYGYSEEMARPPMPSPAAVSERDRVLGWVSPIPQEKFVIRRVVQCRALINTRSGRHVYSWRKLATFLHCDLRAAQRWHAEGIATIVGRLNRPGLCELAAGETGPGRQLVREALAHIKAAEPVRRKPIKAVAFV